jgi:hypothetical protein
VQVRYSEDIASHTGLKPCGVSREGCGEASAEGYAGQPLSHEMSIPGADAVRDAEGNTAGSVIVSALLTRRGRRPWHARKLLAREPGDLMSSQRPDSRLARGRKARSRRCR